MVKFSVGLPISKREGFIESVGEHLDKIGEVYFSFGSFASGRSAQSFDCDSLPHEVMERQLRELDALYEMGLSFNLLFNANCYGGDAISRQLMDKIGRTVDYVGTRYNLSSITTTSPIIAKFIKNNFESLETRASVNMEIGSKEGIDYISELFDGFYLKREYNRYQYKIKEMSDYCHKNGKKLYCLANSGCLNFCSAHNFHDNLVAHEAEISTKDNAYLFEGICHSFLKREGGVLKYLSHTNIIRPEDLNKVSGYFDGIKLATRISADPVSIIEAYTSEKFGGAVSELLEPNHSALFYPYVIDNSRIDSGFYDKASACEKNCDECEYCKEITRSALVSLEGFAFAKNEDD